MYDDVELFLLCLISVIIILCARNENDNGIKASVIYNRFRFPVLHQQFRNSDYEIQCSLYSPALPVIRRFFTGSCVESIVKSEKKTGENITLVRAMYTTFYVKTRALVRYLPDNRESTV